MSITKIPFIFFFLLNHIQNARLLKKKCVTAWIQCWFNHCNPFFTRTTRYTIPLNPESTLLPACYSQWLAALISTSTDSTIDVPFEGHISSNGKIILPFKHTSPVFLHEQVMAVGCCYQVQVSQHASNLPTCS